MCLEPDTWPGTGACMVGLGLMYYNVHAAASCSRDRLHNGKEGHAMPPVFVVQEQLLESLGV